MSAGIPVIKFLFRNEFKVLNDALNIAPGYRVEEFPNANDLSTYLSTESAGLVISSLNDKNDLIQIATLVKLVKKVAKDTAVKIVVINFCGDRNFDKAIAKLGIQDVVEIGINTKALKFKLDFWMKSLNAQIKNNPNSKTANTVKSLEPGKNQDKKENAPQAPVWQEPLDLEDDIWILKNDADCKKVLSKWLIRLLGPSPYIGQWIEVKSGHWRFDIKETEKEMYCPNKGSWFFSGDQKPDFVWKENIWMITGDNFELYYKDGAQVSSRLKLKDKVLTIAKNSLFAKTKEPIIIESFDKELVFKREAEKLEDLEGKNKTDQINGGPLSGKNKPADKLGGNLSGEVESEEAIKHDNLVQKTSTAKENKYWGGKNSADAPASGDFDGPKSDNPNAGSDLSRDRKDNTHQKYYKNHNEAEKYEAVPEKERAAREAVAEKQAGNLSGKSSTDEVPKHYDNSKTQKEKEAAAKKPEDEYSGKSNTDKLKNLGSKEKPEAQEKEAKEKDLDGKSSTDKLESHYGGPKSRPNTPEEKERERKEKEEKIFKERLQTAERNKAEQAERERKTLEEIAEAKTKNEKARDDKEQAATRKNQVEAVEQAATRKNQVEAKEQAETRKSETDNKADSKTKTAVEKNWEGDHDYEMSGQSETEKLSAHYKSKKQEASEKEKAEKEAPVDLFSKKKDKPEVESAKEGKAAVLPFGKKEDKKPITAEEKRLEDITRDARVISTLTQNGKKTDCNLDDFFDETIIFSTSAQHIETSAKVFLDLLFKFEKDTKLKMEGNVITVEGDGEGNHYVTVQVSKESAVALGSFMKLYEVRQQNVNEFLKKVKGL